VVLHRIKVQNIFLLSKASNSLSPQEILQYVAAIPNNIHYTVFLRNANHDIPCPNKTNRLCCFHTTKLCTVLKVRKSHKPNPSVAIRDFIYALRTCTHSANSASCVVHSFTYTYTLNSNDTPDRRTGSFCSDPILPTHYRNTRTTFQVPLPSFQGPKLTRHLFKIRVSLILL
jgi:hypothetical protein